MADIVITLTIPDAKVAKAIDGFLARFPNESGLTTKQWVTRVTANWLRDQVNQGEAILNEQDNPDPIRDDGTVTE